MSLNTLSQSMQGELPFAVLQQTNEVIMEKLAFIVEEGIADIADATGLSAEKVFVMLKECTVEEIRADAKNSGKPHATRLCDAVNEVNKAISIATGLNTEEISTIFTHDSDATVQDVVNRLHEKSVIDRWNLASV